MSGDDFAAAAARQGVKVLPGRKFYATSGPANHVRLAFSYASPSEIVEGVKRLGNVLSEETCTDGLHRDP